jgi:predicted ATP-dependent endonuclease of OLD family
MLNSLLIRNYKNLKEFKLDSLARINLITGRNNTGKSTLLEAISLYASKGDLNYLFQILEEHGEIYKSPQGGISVHDNNIRAISSLFTDRLVSVDPIDAISIGPVEENLFGTALESAENVLTL